MGEDFGQALSYLILGRPLTGTGEDENLLAQAALGLGLMGSSGITTSLANLLGLKVVAEGVELEGSLRLLKHWHCDTAQGYLISRPLEARAFEAWLGKTRLSV